MATPNPTTIIQKDTIRVAAESVGVELSEDVVKALCQEAEYRVREITQEAIKFMRHSKRNRLTTEDINNALKLRNVEVLFGYGMREPLVFKKASNATDLFFTEDKELVLEEVINTTKLPPLPMHPSYTVHWLAVEGVQPDIPQNPLKTIRSATSKDVNAKTEALILEEPEVKPSIRHVLSKELQEFYEKLTDSILNGEALSYQAALSAMASDPGLHQLLPYFCQFITKQVADNLQNLHILTRMMRMVHGILINPNIHVDHYLHQIIPVVLTCLVGKRLCENPTENHWALRDHAAEIIGLICFRWGKEYASIQPRIVKTLLHAFLDVKKPLTTHYGSIVGLSRLGPHTRQLVLLPNLDRYFKYLIPAMEQTENTIKRSEALMCYQALLAASGQYLFESAKVYSNGELLLLEASVSSHLRPTKIAKTADGKTKFSLESTLKAIQLEDLIPMSQHYAHLYDLFGESLFPYITRRSEDLASSLVI